MNPQGSVLIHSKNFTFRQAELMNSSSAMLYTRRIIGDETLWIWKAGDGTRVAWFKDPDGHTLSVAQF